MNSNRLAQETQILDFFLQHTLAHDGIQPFLQKSLFFLAKIIPTAASSIFVLDPSTNTLSCQAATGPASENLSDFSIPLGIGIIGHVANQGKPLIYNDIKEAKNHLSSISAVLDFSFQSLIAYPITVDQKVFGVLEMMDKQPFQTFSEEDCFIIDFFCQKISIPLKHMKR